MSTSTSAVSDAVYKTLVEYAPDGIVIVGQEGRIVVVNSQTEKLFGYDRAELIDKPIEVLIPERFRGKHRGHRAGLMSSPQLRPMGAGLELHGMRKDGTEFPVEISLSSVQSPNGLLVSSQTEKLFGYLREELLGQPVEVLIPERFWNQHRHHRSAYSTHPQFRPMGVGLELYGIRKNGTEFPLEISLSPQQTKDGVLIASTIRDITDRKKIEDALRHSEASFRALVEDNYGVCRARLDGSLLMVNQPFVQLLGYDSQEEVLALNLATQVFAMGEFSLSLSIRPDATGSSRGLNRAGNGKTASSSTW